MRLFVGDDPDYNNNAECEGGPFLDVNDPSNYVKVSYTNEITITD